MQKKKISVLIAIAAAFAGFMPGPRIIAQEAVKSVSDEVPRQKYTCVMHPEVISDKPGKCPKCGMTLIQRK